MNGIIVVNKDSGYTSRDVVNIISSVYKTKKVGHTGTLDPLAKGVLIVCVGKALKVAEYITADDKEYITKFRLGYLTDTLDIEGKCIKTSNKKVSEEDVKEALNKFKGNIIQEVPIYSAVKVNGKKLYEYARNDKDVVLPKREVNIYSIDFIDMVDDVVTIKVKVSKGTYIRSLIRDIGNYLGCYATMCELVRTKQGNINIESASTISEIKDNKHHIYSINDILGLPTIKVTDKVILKKVNNGVKYIDISINSDKVLLLDDDNRELAIYEKVDENTIKLVKML